MRIRTIVAFLGLLLGVAALFAGCTGTSGDVTTQSAGGGEVFVQGGGEVFTQAQGEVFLEPMGAAGPDSFAGDAFLVDQSVPSPTVPSITTVPTIPGAPVQLASFSGDTPGLYGGSRSKLIANKEAQLAFLEQNFDKAVAFCAALNADAGLRWSGGTQVQVEQLAAYFAELTPMLLTRDTRVTNHGFRNGQPTPRQSVLQAGQLVLVDRYGVPRVRCECGNPLIPPVAVPTAPKYTGSPWPAFDPGAVVVVQQTAVIIETFVLIDVDTGQTFDRPAGTSGAEDAARATGTTVVPTTMLSTTTVPTTEVSTTVPTTLLSTTTLLATTTTVHATTTTLHATTTSRSTTTTHPPTTVHVTTTSGRLGVWKLEVSMSREDPEAKREMTIAWNVDITVNRNGTISGSGSGSYHVDGHIWEGSTETGTFSADAHFGVKVTGTAENAADGLMLHINQTMTSYQIDNLQLDTSSDYSQSKAAVEAEVPGWIKAAFTNILLEATSSPVYASLMAGNYFGSANLSPVR